MTGASPHSERSLRAADVGKRSPSNGDVFTAAEIALAARVPERLVEALVARGEIRTLSAFMPVGLPVDADLDSFIPHHEAVRVVRALAAGMPVGLADGGAGLGREIFAHGPKHGRSSTLPLIVSTTLHGLVAATILFIASLGFASADEKTEPLKEPEPIRLVFLAIPGPGGGGGGGGLRMKTPPPRAERKGERKISSPLPARKLPPPIRPAPVRPEPPPRPIEAKQLPPVMAPIVTAPADKKDQEGLLAKSEEPKPSQGPGVGGGVGSGQGTGLGPGDGTGVGDGSGGGTGGGPYRPGSGVDPPRLLREVRADYSDAARRANVEGEVVMEIVIRRDGSVGEVTILRGLPLDLNDRARLAVKQWKFSPARMKGTPVDVIVEVSVEFRLR
jgi:periplasmic protein TonB